MPTTTATTAAATTDQPSYEHWEFVRQLLHDLDQEEDRERIAYILGQWRLSIRAFRRVEEQRMVQQDPTSQDLLLHKACVTALLSTGAIIQALAHDHSPSDLAAHGVNPDTIAALMQDLHNTLDEWHGQACPDRLAQLRDNIFNASPELDLRTPRP